MTIPFFAITTRGLESIVAADCARQPQVTVTEQRYRQVHGTVADDLSAWRALMTCPTADDLFVTLAEWDAIRHTRDMLPDLAERSARLDIAPRVPLIARLRPISEPIQFSITVSFVGKRNYSVPEMKAALAQGIRQRYPHWHYQADDHAAALNIRLMIEHQHGLVGVRLAAAPLHRRAYKQQSLSGSLKPPVAAAMITLAAGQVGTGLLDPFCGSGTVLIEAARQGRQAIGGDSASDALRVSRQNSHHANVRLALSQWDACRLPLPSNSVQAVVSNLPWGRQIQVDATLRTLYQRSYAEMRRVLCDACPLVLLTTAPQLLPDSPTQQFEISVHGQTPSILLYTP